MQGGRRYLTATFKKGMNNKGYLAISSSYVSAPSFSHSTNTAACASPMQLLGSLLGSSSHDGKDIVENFYRKSIAERTAWIVTFFVRSSFASMS